jgi:hypothetical protein
MSLRERFLFEKWSHCDEIDGAVERVYKRIGEIAPDAKEETVMENRIFLRRGEFDENFFGKKMHVFFFMFIARNEEDIDVMVDKYAGVNGIEPDEKTMYITIYTLNGTLLEPVSNKNVSHEIKHVYQMAKVGSGNVNYTNLADMAYERSSNVLNEPNQHSESELNVAWLYYYSNPYEQDAFVEEYYKDLCHLRQFMENKNSETHQRLAMYRWLIDWYFDNRDNPEVSIAVSQYRIHGMPKRNFETMIRNGYKRFEKKIRNIEKHFKQTDSYLREHLFRGGVRTKTGSLITFKL